MNAALINVLEKKAAAWRGRGERLGEVVIGQPRTRKRSDVDGQVGLTRYGRDE